MNCDRICEPASELAGEDVLPEPLACRICELQPNPQQLNAATVHLAVKHVRHDTPRLNAILQAHGDMLRAYQPPDEPLNAAVGASRLKRILGGTGVGSQLWRLLEEIDVRHSPTCPCLDWAERMNAWGPDGCRQEKGAIVRHMRRSARAYGWSQLAKAALKAATRSLAWRLNPRRPFSSLLDEAIRRAEAAAKPSGRPLAVPSSDRAAQPSPDRFDVESHLRALPYHPVIRNIGAVTCYFNPQQSRNRIRNYRLFARQFPRIGLDLFTAEGSVGGERWEIPAGPRTLRYEYDPQTYLFSKENLLNLAFQQLPDRYDTILWIDADVVFVTPDYARCLADTLATHTVAQGFQTLQYLDQDGRPVTGWLMSMVYRNVKTGTICTDAAKAYPGLVWAASRELLAAVGGLYDRVITGGGDNAWLGAVYGRLQGAHRTVWPEALVDAVDQYAARVHPHVKSIGFVPAKGVHLYHGSLKSRQYRERNEAFRKWQFDPDAHLEYAANGTLRWSKAAPIGLRDGVRAYIFGRKEDQPQDDNGTAENAGKPPANTVAPKKKANHEPRADVAVAARPQTQPIDILIPLGPGSHFADAEIRYALRSIQRYATGWRHIVIVGHIPEFLRETDRIRLVWRREFRGNKASRISLKVQWAFENLDLTETVAFWNDDYLLIAPIDVRTIPNYYRGTLARKITGTSGSWQRTLQDTCDALAAVKRPTLHYDIHVPIRFVRTPFLQLADWWERSRKHPRGFVMKSVYGNHCCHRESATTKDCKLQRTWSPEQMISLVGRGRWIVSYGDGALQQGFVSWMSRLLPTPGSWEKQPIQHRGNRR